MNRSCDPLALIPQFVSLFRLGLAWPVNGRESQSELLASHGNMPKQAPACGVNLSMRLEERNVKVRTFAQGEQKEGADVTHDKACSDTFNCVQVFAETKHGCLSPTRVFVVHQRWRRMKLQAIAGHSYEGRDDCERSEARKFESKDYDGLEPESGGHPQCISFKKGPQRWDVHK